MPSTRETVERYARSLEEADLDAQDAVLHEDVVSVFPQSGERILGRANRRAMIENYPGSADKPITGTVRQIVGSDEQWAVGPSFNITHIAGSSDEYAIAGTITYPNGELWHNVELLKLRAGKIAHITAYFGQPFDPPAWRLQWVEEETAE
ncbi:MAG TPA: nuclear transport factor 2 family protein [Methylomirabilota bacterium]